MSESNKTFTFGRPKPRQDSNADGWLEEDDVKRHIKAWLEGLDWQVEIAWGNNRGPDIVAQKGGKRWLIEAKGGGGYQQIRASYFSNVLGVLLQRMDDPSARYSIALPSMNQFRGLWKRLPDLAKSRLGMTALFVSLDGTVEELGTD
jgi:hypothetical protein